MTALALPAPGIAVAPKPARRYSFQGLITGHIQRLIPS